MCLHLNETVIGNDLRRFESVINNPNHSFPNLRSFPHLVRIDPVRVQDLVVVAGGVLQGFHHSQWQRERG